MSAASEIVPKGSDDGMNTLHAPEIAEGSGVYYDGTSNRKRRVTLRFADALHVIEDGVTLATWPYAGIRRADNPKNLRLSCISAAPLARLEIEDDATARAILSRSPSVNAATSPAQTWRIVGWSLAAVCSIVLVTLYGIPLLADRLAPLVPHAVEKRIGEAVDKQVRAIFGGKVCERPDGQAAFAKMVDKLRVAGGVDQPLEAQVLSASLPNAFALPGGKVYLMDGLLQKAQSPDEIAGVIAHELGHVQHRDNLRKVIQTGGTSFLIGLLFGDITGGSAVIFASRSILDASYSRDAETDADAFATKAMHKLGRSPRPMGEFLVRVTGGKGKQTATILDSHPLSEDRLARMKQDDRPVTGPEILTAQEWRALKDICKAR
jgi:predicted Zn-dependent protease